MDWIKMNQEEVNYFCTSWYIDFDCYPLSGQIEYIIDIFYYYQITKFSIGDLQEFYRRMQIPKPRGNGVRKPSPTQLLKVVQGMKNVMQIGENFFEIISADTKIYADAIRK